MNFEKALPLLKQGKKIRRAYWPKGIYLKVVGDDVREIDEADDKHGNWWFTSADLLEDDWIVVKDFYDGDKRMTNKEKSALLFWAYASIGMAIERFAKREVTE